MKGRADRNFNFIYSLIFLEQSETIKLLIYGGWELIKKGGAEAIPYIIIIMSVFAAASSTYYRSLAFSYSWLFFIPVD